MNELSDAKQKERNLVNSIERLANRINELDSLIGLSTKVLQQLERTESSGNLVESGSESKPVKKPDIIGIIETFSERINQITNATGRTLDQISKIIG